MEDLDDIITELDGKRYGSLSIWEKKFVDGLVEGGRMKKVKVGLFGLARNSRLEKVPSLVRGEMAPSLNPRWGLLPLEMHELAEPDYKIEPLPYEPMPKSRKRQLRRNREGNET